MKNKRPLILIAALVCATVAAAFLHLSTRTQAAPGSIYVSDGGRERILRFDDLPLVDIEGEIVNGKGETLAINARGVSLSVALEEAGIDPESISGLTVVADDEYRAELTGGEVRARAACLVRQEDGGVRLIVFGDPDSKRSVSGVARMEVQ